MRAGLLRRRVTFQRETIVSDGGGGGTASWSNIAGLASISAHFRPERSRERLEAGRIEAAVAGTLRMRSFVQSRSITTADRVIIDLVPYEIRAITNPDGMNIELEMTVERGVAVGGEFTAMTALIFNNTGNSGYLPLFEDI